MFVSSGMFGYILKNGGVDQEYEICLVCVSLKANHTAAHPCVFANRPLTYEVCEMRELDLMAVEHFYFKRFKYFTDELASFCFK